MTYEKLWQHPEYFIRPVTHTGVEYPYTVSQVRIVVRHYRLIR